MKLPANPTGIPMSIGIAKDELGGRPTIRVFGPAYVALCAVLLSGCGEMRSVERERDAVAVRLGNPEVRHPIGFAPKTEGLEVEVPAGADGLSPNQQVDVYRFLRRYQREAVGRLVITVPMGVHDRAAVARSVQDIQRQVAEAGIDYRLINAARHDARSGDTPTVRLAYRRPTAIPPRCDDWSRDVGRNEARIPYPNWGCATQRNLAVSVEQRTRPWPAAAGRPIICRAAQRDLVCIRERQRFRSREP